ncbi:MAG: hypothetical protein AB7S26_09645 [Sandaracinaceae bacterium]
MRSSMLKWMVVGSALGAWACSSTHYVEIRHPLQVGQVDPNSVPFEALREERPRGLPGGTLVDEAHLTEVTPERVCAGMNLWSLDEVNVARGDYNEFRIALLNDQDGVEVDTGTVQLEQPITQGYQGHIARQVPVGWRNVCNSYRNGRCVSYRQERVWRTIYEPHVWQVTNHPATVCFPNGGFVTPSTSRVAIEMDGHGPGRMVFEWQFQSAVQGGPPPQQQQQASN